MRPEMALEVDSLTRIHGSGAAAVSALQDVTLDVRRGELVAVMGQSGSGKSTLLNIAGGLDRPTSGTVTVCGESLAGLSAARLAALRRQRIGYVFQDYNLVPALTALENVALPLELDGIRTREARRRAAESLERVGLADLGARFPDQLSGGQQQRVAIARAVVGDRRLLLADEPTGALDSHTGEQILELIRDQCDAGASALMVTHEARHAAWADRVVFLKDGEVVDEVEAASASSVLAGNG